MPPAEFQGLRGRVGQTVGRAGQCVACRHFGWKRRPDRVRSGEDPDVAPQRRRQGLHARLFFEQAGEVSAKRIPVETDGLTARRNEREHGAPESVAPGVESGEVQGPPRAVRTDPGQPASVGRPARPEGRSGPEKPRVAVTKVEQPDPRLAAPVGHEHGALSPGVRIRLGVVADPRRQQSGFAVGPGHVAAPADVDSPDVAVGVTPGGHEKHAVAVVCPARLSVLGRVRRDPERHTAFDRLDPDVEVAGTVTRKSHPASVRRDRRLHVHGRVGCEADHRRVRPEAGPGGAW